MEEEATQQPSNIRARHIKKRALKNKALAVSFSEKDLKDYVTGFHKRKKKRRKEAQHKLEEAERRKRLEARKKRKLEREFVLYGGAQPDPRDGPEESDEDHEGDEEEKPIASVSGTMMYDNDDVKVTVTTSEISHEEDHPSRRQPLETSQFVAGAEKQKKHNVPVSKKKQFKTVAKKRSRPKPQSKRDKKKGKRKNKKQ